MENKQPHIYSKENLKSDKKMIETVSKKIDRHEKAKSINKLKGRIYFSF